MTAICNIHMQLKDVLPVITEHYYGSVEKQPAIILLFTKGTLCRPQGVRTLQVWLSSYIMKFF